MSSLKNASPTPSLTPVMQQYVDEKAKYPDYLLFFRMGDFFELFFEDAVIASKALDIVLTKRGKNDDQDIPMCGVPVHAYENYMGRLIQKGFKVALCDQVETPEEAKKRSSKGPIKREVVRLITPGTVVEENLLHPKKHNFIACLSPVDVKKNCLSLSVMEITTSDVYVQTIKLSEIGTILASFDPVEILVPDKLMDHTDLRRFMFETYRSRLSYIADARFNLFSQQHHLETLYKVPTLSILGDFQGGEIIALGVLLEYIANCQKQPLYHLKTPRYWQENEVVQIDLQTRRNLEIDRRTNGERTGSLLDILDHTQTPMGARLLRQRLHFPLRIKDRIEKRLDQTQLFINQEDLCKKVVQHLKNLPDLERSLARLSFSKGGPRDLAVVLENIGVFLNLTQETPLHAVYPLLIHAMTGELQKIYDTLITALEDQLPLLARDGGFIQSAFCEKLATFRSMQQNSEDVLQKLQQRYIHETGISSLKIKRNNVIGTYIEITAMHASKVPPTFIHRQTMASAMRFTTKELSELSIEIEQAAILALQRELEIFESLTKNILKFRKELMDVATLLATCDVASSHAMFAKKHSLCRPLFCDDTSLHVEKGRHIVVEALNDSFTPNGCHFDEHCRVILLTGPNMAGKSTYLRQVALIALMAQAGLFVPASFVHIGLIDRLFSRIGASDDLATGKSTFMVEMMETATILNQATERSLLILDEVGRGTSTFDGMAIAWAVLCDIAKRLGCRTLFATHYHELTSLKDEFKSLKCFTMRICEHEDQILFTHEIIEGTADKSYGLHVAQKAGLPAHVLEAAGMKLQELENKSLHESKVQKIPITQESLKPSAVLIELQNINPDELTPKEALEKLYALKGLMSPYRSVA